MYDSLRKRKNKKTGTNIENDLPARQWHRCQLHGRRASGQSRSVPDLQRASVEFDHCRPEKLTVHLGKRVSRRYFNYDVCLCIFCN